MYPFMYIYNETITEEEYFSSTRLSVKNYKKRSTTGLVPKPCLEISYMFSEDYELDRKIYEKIYI